MSHTLKIVKIVFTVLLLTFALAHPAAAQDHVLGELYGSGVHAYFSGNYERALEFLTSAISQGSTDPRCFYFRGLTQMRMGFESVGKDDFRMGARFEAADPGVLPVGRSLERIQGFTRLLLEKYRREARIQARQQRILRDRTRYQVPRGSGTRLPMQHPPAELDVPALPDDADDAARDPFVDEAEERPVRTGPVEKAPERPPATEEADVVDGDAPAMDDDTTDVGDPFGEDTELFDDEEEVDADPFGEDMGDGDEDPFSVQIEDPFGDE